MDDFLQKRPNKRRPHVSLDGISRPSKTPRPKSDGTIGFDKPSSYSPRKAKLDDFSRREGFRPAAQAPLATAESANEPIVIEKQAGNGFRRNGRKTSGFNKIPKRKKPVSKKKKVFRAFAAMSVIVILITGFLFAKGYLNLRKVLSGGGGAAALQENVDPSRLKGEGDGRVNILLLGRGGEGHEGADLTDTLILASIDPVAKEAALVSIPRDTYVSVPGYGSMKINQVFYTGKTNALNRYSKKTNETKKQAEDAGFALSESVVEKTLGVPVHYHAMVDFDGFKKAVDNVNGVSLNVPKPVTEQMRIDGRAYYLNVKPGQQNFDGFKALAYARSRYTSERGDFDRSERQRLIIAALKDKTLSVGTFSNPQKISNLLSTFGNHVQTNFSTQDLSRLHEITKDIQGNKIVSIGLADPPNNYLTTGSADGLSVVIPTAGRGNFKEIQNYLRNVLKDSYLKSENANVVVLNGTPTAGLATQKADELKSYGYNVSKVENAPTKNYTRTVVVDLRGGSKKYTRNYLEKRYGVTAVGNLPDANILPGNADFVIIIGSDQAKTTQ